MSEEKARRKQIIEFIREEENVDFLEQIILICQAKSKMLRTIEEFLEIKKEHRIKIKKEFYSEERWKNIQKELNLDDSVQEFIISFSSFEVKKNQMTK